MTVSEEGTLNTYNLDNKKMFIGLHKSIKPGETAIYQEAGFSHNLLAATPQFVMAILIPKEEIDAHNFRIRLRLLLVIAVLLFHFLFQKDTFARLCMKSTICWNFCGKKMR